MKPKAMYYAIKRNLKNFAKSPSYRSRFYMASNYGKKPIDDKKIFFESYTGNNFSGNVYRIFEEISSRDEFKDYKKIIGVQKSALETVDAFLKANGYSDYTLVPINSRAYSDALLTSKYLINNSTLPVYFIKNPEQVLINTWHGTPLKMMGRQTIGGKHEIGNSQRNFMMAGYLAFPNQFTLDHMRQDYMLDQKFKGQYILDGYPRNHVFYEKDRQDQLKKKLGLEGKEVIAYMPTWRGKIDARKNAQQIEELTGYLAAVDETLNDDKVMYVNLHNFVKSQIDLSQFKHIKPFPKDVETYEFLAIADALITDYSSVFFDYANTGRKIILFAYDKDDYLANRGLYLELEGLPFAIAENADQLISELKDLKDYQPYPEFMEEFCTYDHRDSAKEIVETAILGEQLPDVQLIPGEKYANDKENVLIFTGNLAKNGLTTSLKGLINHIDLDDKNYTLYFYRNSGRNNQDVMDEFPEKISYIPIQGAKDITLTEALVHFLYYRLNIDNDWIRGHLDRIYRREIQRIFPNQKFDHAIHFTGYEKQMAHLIDKMDDDVNKIIYVHNDMSQEKKTRSNFHEPSLYNAYRNFDKIAGVREGIEDGVLKLVPDIDPKKIHIVHNVNNIETIKTKAQLPVAFDPNTESTHSIAQINKILADKNAIKFVNVARYSPEKRLKRLIKAFEEFNQEHPDSYLFIIGGHGDEYKSILHYVWSRNLTHIILIKSLTNPFSIVKDCDYFVLSSHYEGLPMSIMEALILGVPVISTNIEGPRKFLEQGYGYLVDESREGVLKGLREAYNGNIHLKKFDPYDFNEQAIEEFYDLLK